MRKRVRVQIVGWSLGAHTKDAGPAAQRRHDRLKRKGDETRAVEPPLGRHARAELPHVGHDDVGGQNRAHRQVGVVKRGVLARVAGGRNKVENGEEAKKGELGTRNAGGGPRQSAWKWSPSGPGACAAPRPVAAERWRREAAPPSQARARPSPAEESRIEPQRHKRGSDHT